MSAPVFYLGYLLRGIGLGLSLPFLPAFLLDAGFDLPKVLLFYSGVYACWSLIAFASAPLSRITGSKPLFLFSLFLEGLFLLLLPEVRRIPFLLMFLYGGGESLYWVLHHTYFSNLGKNSEEIRNVRLAGILSGLLAPLVGGFSIELLGKGVLLGFAAGFLFLSLLLFLHLGEMPGEIRPVINPKRALWSFFYVQHYVLEGILWPLFVYLFAGGYSLLGSLASFLQFFSLLTPVLLSHLYGDFLYGIGEVLSFLVDSLRPFNLTPLGTFAVNFAYSPVADAREGSSLLKVYRAGPPAWEREVFTTISRSFLSFLAAHAVSPPILFVALPGLFGGTALLLSNFGREDESRHSD